MKISDLIADFITKQGIEYVFGYIGGAITHIVDSIDKNPNVKFIQVYHEQTGAIAAEGYARETGNCGVAMATSGPGATNLLTGIADAYFDSLPVVYLTGQVNTYEYKYDKPVRQQGFQEMDIVSMASSVTKYAKMIDKPEDVLPELEKAFSIAVSGRPGPVLLDIPMNIQRAEIELEREYENRNLKHGMEKLILNDEIIKTICDAKRPLLLVGGGMKSLNQDMQYELQEFVRETQIPVICSLMGKGFFQEENINFLGMIGSYGNRCANMSIANADLIIAVGSRLDTRQTGACFDQFMKDGKIIQIDIDNNELDYHRITNKYNLNMDAGDFINQFMKLKISVNSDWCDYLRKLQSTYNQDKEIERFVENKKPYRLIQAINSLSVKDDVFVADIGQNQMWSAQTLKIKEGQNFYTSGGLAPMGFSIPFAIGLAFGNRNRRVFSINGDGGFHIGLQGLMLISQYSLPVKCIVINNESLGMITQFQGLYFNNNMVGTTEQKGYLVPDLEAIAKAYSLNYCRLTGEDLQDQEVLDRVFNNNTPYIIEYMTDGLTTVSPKLEFNKPIYDPTPQLDEEELQQALTYK